MNWDDDEDDREDYPEDYRPAVGLSCTMCGSTDWPRSDTSCPLCREEEKEEDE